MIIMQSKIITIWYRFNFISGTITLPGRIIKIEKWEHNHISDGWDENQHIPKSCTEQQKNAWKKIKWKKIKGELRNGKVFKYEE